MSHADHCPRWEDSFDLPCVCGVDATSSSAPSPNGETDMNDIDIEEGRRLWAAVNNPEDLTRIEGYSKYQDDKWAWRVWRDDNAAAMFDAIETGRQWETIARRLEPRLAHADHCPRWEDSFDLPCVCGIDDLLAAFRDVADRTPNPHHDGGAG